MLYKYFMVSNQETKQVKWADTFHENKSRELEWYEDHQVVWERMEARKLSYT